MKNLNWEKYFSNNERGYYNPTYLVTILEDILGSKFEDIKSDVNGCIVSVTEKEIIEFLAKTFEEENPELKKRIEASKPKRSGNMVDWTEQDVKDWAQEFDDSLCAGRYSFSPYTLKYFNKYSSIVRNKAIVLLNMIEQLGKKDYEPIQSLMIELDIVLNQNGEISKEDIIRLLTPTIYNIALLKHKVEEANNLSTYLTFKMSKHSLLREGISEGEIYPSKALQIKSLFYSHIEGNVPLSNKQEQELRQEELRSFTKCLGCLFE